MAKCINIKCSDYRKENNNGCSMRANPELCWGFVSKDNSEHKELGRLESVIVERRH